MAVVLGDQFSAGIGVQATPGIAATDIYYSSADSVDINQRIEKQPIKNGIKNIVDHRAQKITKKYSEPNFSGPVFDVLTGYLLLATLGTVTTTPDSPETGVQTHDFSVKNDNHHPTCTIVRKDDIATKQVIDALLTKFELSLQTGEIAQYTAEFRGKSATDVSVTEVVADQIDFGPEEANVFIADNLTALDTLIASGDDGACIESLTLTIEKPPIECLCLGHLDPCQVINGRLSITGSMTLKYEDESFFIDHTDNTYKAFKIRLKSTQTIGTTTHPEISFTLPKVGYTEIDRENPEGDFARQTIAFKAFFDASEAQAITAQLINTATDYNVS